VLIEGEEHPPNAKKWAGVSMEGGQVTVSWSNVNDAKQERCKPRRPEPLRPDELHKLKRPPTERKFRAALGGIGCAGARPMVSRVSPYNMGKALFGRVFRLPAANDWGRGPMPGVWVWAEGHVDRLLPGFRDDNEVMAIEAWIESMPAKRRRALTQAWEDYKRRGWKPSFAKFTAFVKSEFLPGFDKDAWDIVPLREMLDRIIQGPHDVTHLIAGPYLKPKVHLLKKIWTCEDPIFYGSAGPEALHRWLNEVIVPARGWYFWCDFSMFDNTHSKDSWRFMKKLYRNAMRDPEFRRVMKAWETPRGRIGPLMYIARIMNASGRDDTALANGVLNGFATYLSLLAAWLDKPLMTLTDSDVCRGMGMIRLSVTGDDSLGCVPEMTDEVAEKFREQVGRNIAMFGFEAKFCMSRDLKDVVYLGSRPYPVKHADGHVEWYWGRTIGRATYKMGWVLLDKPKDVMAQITGIADMHCLCSAHVPVLGDLARKIVELRRGMKRTPKEYDPNRPWEWTVSAGGYSELTLEWVAAVYDRPYRRVTVAHVKELLALIADVQALPCVLDHWLWTHMIHCDDL